METLSNNLSSVELVDVARDKVNYLEVIEKQVGRAKELLLPEQVNPEVRNILCLVCSNLERLKEACANEKGKAGGRRDNFRTYWVIGLRYWNIEEGHIRNAFKSRTTLYCDGIYIKDNLYKYIEKQKTPETKGLPKGLVWLFAKQIANGLSYLHRHNPPIAHRDLKPDSILLDTRSMHLKLAGFSLSRHFSEDLSYEEPEAVFDARWTAPELWDQLDDDIKYASNEHSNEASCDRPEGYEEDIYSLEEELQYYISADIYSYGQIVAYMITGDTPWPGIDSLSVRNRQIYKDDDKVIIPVSLTGKLKDIIHLCRNRDPDKRPNMAYLLRTFFSEPNPYQSEAESAEFFSCGFLNNTKIFVADSLVDETSDGYFKTGVFPQGYPVECLKCKVEVGNREHNNVPNQWVYEHQYRENYAHFKQQAFDKKIEDNPAIALKRLATPREEEEERQEILLQYSESTYCHHRAVREIWRLLDEPVQREFVPCKSIVHPVFSTSFGLHIAVLTADKPRKFIFSRRSNREGMATPGKFTCGAVESASIKDYVEVNGTTYVDLVKTAVRGLKEKLRIELKGQDLEALCLSTVYLRFDTHEWEMCGFVDLSDPRVDPERQLTFSEVGSRFTTGPKDKFEHEEVVAVNFELPAMAEFVRENFENFASSSKLVVVEVLQSFFGVAAVERIFKAYV